MTTRTSGTTCPAPGPVTTYQVVLKLDAGLGCQGHAFVLPTAQLMTNRAGNANGRADFSVAEVEAVGLQPGQYSIMWEVEVGDQSGPPVSATKCEPLFLDARRGPTRPAAR